MTKPKIALHNLTLYNIKFTTDKQDLELSERKPIQYFLKKYYLEKLYHA